MGLLSFLGRAASKTGQALRSLGSVGGTVLRTAVGPLAPTLKPLVGAVSQLTGFGQTPLGGAITGAIQKGLDYLGSSRPQELAQKVSAAGDRLGGLGAQLAAG